MILSSALTITLSAKKNIFNKSVNVNTPIIYNNSGNDVKNFFSNYKKMISKLDSSCIKIRKEKEAR